MSYLEKLRGIVNEINIGDTPAQSDDTPDDEGGNENFMDDGNDDTPTTDDSSDTPDDEGGNENFMDDDDSGSDDTTPDESSPDTGDDDTSDEDGNENFMDDDSSDDEGDSEQSSEEGSDSDDESGDENFMDSGDDEGDGGEESGEESSSEEEGSDDENNEDNQEYDINKIEDELFSSLTPEQIAIKNHELKNQFIELYSIIGSTLVRINDVSKTNENINVLKFITEKLLELREMVDFNVTTAYQTRTYIENNIIYQQCIATLNAIADIIDNIPKLNDDNNKVDNEETEDKGEPVEKDEESSDYLNISDSSMSDYQEESTDYNTLF